MTDLPPDLAAAVRELSEGRRDLAASASRISEHYRQRGASRQVIGGTDDVIAYALTRMPATYAAVAKVVDDMIRHTPGWSAGNMLDVGAGPGTATWAVADMFPGINAVLIDHNPTFRAVAEILAKDVPLGRHEVRDGDLTSFDLKKTFHLVTCAYALTELADDVVLAAAERLWRHCDGVLLLVEPGRPRDYQRLMAIRAHLVGQGASVLAPCPHERACPLVEPDWCHFSVRLSRSRDHMRMKGGTLGYEDEKFSYLILARPGIGARASGRVLRRPEENKFSATLGLCTETGLEQRVVPSRDKPAFKAAKKLDWGDAV